MRYIELITDTPSDEIELRCEEMTELGAESFVIESEEDFKNFLEGNQQYWDYVDEELENKFKGLSRIKCYLCDDENGREVFKKIIAAFPETKASYVQDSDWENNWREYYKPIETGKKLVVVPEWEDIPDDGRTALRLDPGLIFGTGSHATTRMCLEALENYAGEGTKVLDLGCGSGILGIASLVLGSDFCLGCDIDPKAPDVVMSNAALNNIYSEHLKAVAGDIITDASLRASFGTGYDLVLSNIVSDVIIALASYVPQFIKKDGIYISSGIIEGRQDEVRSAIEAAGFDIIDHRCLDDWHCFTAKLKN